MFTLSGHMKSSKSMQDIRCKLARAWSFISSSSGSAALISETLCVRMRVRNANSALEAMHLVRRVWVVCLLLVLQGWLGESHVYTPGEPGDKFCYSTAGGKAPRLLGFSASLTV